MGGRFSRNLLDSDRDGRTLGRWRVEAVGMRTDEASVPVRKDDWECMRRRRGTPAPTRDPWHPVAGTHCPQPVDFVRRSTTIHAAAKELMRST